MHKDPLKREEYPICPECRSPVAAVMMTSDAINPDGTPFRASEWSEGDVLYYHPDALSVYCTRVSCKWGHMLSDIKAPSWSSEVEAEVTE